MNPPEPPPTILPLASPPPGAGLPSPASGPQDAGAGAGGQRGRGRGRATRGASGGATGGAGVPSRVHIRSAGAGVPDPAAVGGRKRGTRPTVFEIRDLSVDYGTKPALAWTTMKIERNLVTAVIGPSGCGKSTFIRCLNRMNDSVRGFSLRGQVLYHGHDLYAPGANRVEVRRRIGMVFQKPNPFPKSIYDNVAWAPRNLGLRHDLDERVERALRDAALWDEVKDRLPTARSAYPAASSSDCASPARSPPSPTCSCSTSQPPRWIRSPPRRSRTSWPR